MKIIIMQPGETLAVQYVLTSHPASAVKFDNFDKNEDKCIEYETIRTPLDSIFVAGGERYRFGYCERTDTMFRSKIIRDSTYILIKIGKPS